MKDSWINAEVELPKDKSILGNYSRQVIVKLTDEYKQANNIWIDGGFLIGNYSSDKNLFRCGFGLTVIKNMKGLFWQYCE